MFPVDKYKYFTNNKDLVVAEQTFAGKKYRGSAVLKEPDEFNYEIGKQIAAAKCDLKICEARYHYAKKREEYAKRLLEFAISEAEKASDYTEDSSREYFESAKRLNEILLVNK